MILPGLSGSFILIILGNYILILNGISNFNLKILFPVGLGAIAGLVAFSNVLSFLFKKFHDLTIALMTGFIFGSLNILWPWKKKGEVFIKPDGEEKVLSYVKTIPDNFDLNTFFAFGLIVLGIFSIIWLEKWAVKKPA